MNIKKMTHKDRYGNQISYEYEVPEKPLDPTAIVTKGMELEAENRPDVMIQETMMAVPPVGGEQFNMGNPVTHPGEPRGQDTVPAWLTPGEFVVNAEATEMFGPQIEAMNEVGRQMQEGGEVQYHDLGGWIKNPFGKLSQAMTPDGEHALDYYMDDVPESWSGKDLWEWKQQQARQKRLENKRQRGGKLSQPDINALSVMGQMRMMQQNLQHKNDGGKIPPRGSAAGIMAGMDPSAIVRMMGSLGNAYQFVAPALGMEKGGDVPMPVAPPWSAKPAGVDELLHEREGFVDSIYLDSLNKPTVGYGHLIADEEWAKDDPRIGTKPYSQKELDQMFEDDRAKAQNEAVNNVGRERWMSLTPEQQTAMTSMAFQLGGAGQRKFKKLLAAIEAGDNREVAKQALTGSKGGKSKWLKQTPKRALDLAMAFDPDLAAQYKNAGGQVFDDEPHQRAIYREGGGLTNFWNKYIAGPKTQIGAAPAAVAEIPVPEAMPADMFPPGIVDEPNTGHPYAGAVPLGIDPEAVNMEMPGSSISPAAAGEIEDMSIPGSSISPAAEGNFGATGASVPPVNDMDAPGSATDDGGLMNWIFQDNRPDSVKQAEADFNEKIVSGNREEVDATLQNILDRQAKGLPVNEKTLAGAKKAADHQDNQLIEAIDAQAETGTISSDEAETAKAQINNEMIAREQAAQQAAYENEAYGHQGGRNPKKADDMTSEEAASTIESRLNEAAANDPTTGTEEQTGPGADQPGDNATSGQVEGAGKNAPPGEIDKAKGVMQSVFGDLFDSAELKRMAILYAGSRLMGYSHGGSLQWAAKGYLNRVDAKSANRQKQAHEYAKSGKYKPESVALFAKSGNLSDLEAVGTSYTTTGNTMQRSAGGKPVSYQEIKDSAGNVMYRGPKGNVYTAAQIENGSLPYEPEFNKGTPEYRARRSRATGDAAGRFEEVWKAEDRFRVGENEWKTTTNIRPKQAADQFWAWSESMGLDPESDEALTIMTNAYSQAIADGKTGNVKPSSLKPYLEGEYIRETTGNKELFIVGETKPGETPKYVRQDLMTSLVNNIDYVAGKMPRTQGMNQQDARDTIFNISMSEWAKLDADEQEMWNSSAKGTGTSGFYAFTNSNIGKLMNKSQ